MLKIEGIQYYNNTPSYKGRSNNFRDDQLVSKISAVMSEAQAGISNKKINVGGIPATVIAKMIQTGSITKKHTDALESTLNLLI